MNESLTTGWDVVDEAYRALRSTVAALSIEDLTRPTPCDQWNVSQVIQHAAGDQLAYAAAITGGPGPSWDPFAPSGQLDDAMDLVGVSLQTTAGAWRTVSEGRDDVPTPLPQGAMAASLASGAGALDAGVHAWDIAVATGQESPLSAALARELLPVAQSLVEPLRAYGVYAAALPAEPGDDDVATLLRYLGRRPDWSA